MKDHLIPEHVRGPLRVAAKAGFLTKRIWNDYFGTGNRRWRNKRWKQLMETWLFSPAPDYGFMDTVVTLSRQGRELATLLGLDPVYSPPAKNLWHDEELIRLALFLEREGWLANWKTEQELKVRGQGPRLVQPRDRSQKFPDLLLHWMAPGEQVVWAVELERTSKEFTRYYDFVRRYKGISSIDSVLVITASPSIEANIKKAQARVGYPQGQRPMFFTSMSEVTRDPGSSQLRLGAKSITLRKMAQALTRKRSCDSGSRGKTRGPEAGPGGARRKELSREVFCD